MEDVSASNFITEPMEVGENPAESPSWWPNDVIGYDTSLAPLLAKVPVEPYNNVMREIVTAQASDPFAVNVSAKLIDRPIADGTDTGAEDNAWKVVAGALTYEGRMYVSAVDSLQRTVRSLFFDNPDSSYFRALKTIELVSRNFYWPMMDLHACQCISCCEVWHQIKAPWYTRHMIIILLETQAWPWKGVRMDLFTDLLESTTSWFGGILSIVGWLTKIGI